MNSFNEFLMLQLHCSHSLFYGIQFDPDGNHHEYFTMFDYFKIVLIFHQFGFFT